jgi:hypothetical protein
MATWNGTPKKFKLDFVSKDPNQWDLEEGDVELSWKYSTSSDTLEIVAKHPDMRVGGRSDLYGPEWAKAYLYTMADWMATYYSPEELVDFLAPIFKRDTE